MEWTALPVDAVVQVPEGIRVIAMDVPRVVEGFMSAIQIHNIASCTKKIESLEPVIPTFVSHTPFWSRPKTDMEPENDPFGSHHFSGSMLVFRGVYVSLVFMSASFF